MENIPVVILLVRDVTNRRSPFLTYPITKNELSTGYVIKSLYCGFSFSFLFCSTLPLPISVIFPPVIFIFCCDCFFIPSLACPIPQVTTHSQSLTAPSRLGNYISLTRTKADLQSGSGVNYKFTLAKSINIIRLDT